MKEMILDLSTTSLEELLHYQNLLDKEVTKRRQETKREAAQKIRELAKTYQLDVQDIVSSPTSSKRSKVKPKYQHPTQPEVQWSGRGRQPLWVAEWVNEGKSLEALLMQAEVVA